MSPRFNPKEHYLDRNDDGAVLDALIEKFLPELELEEREEPENDIYIIRAILADALEYILKLLLLSDKSFLSIKELGIKSRKILFEGEPILFSAQAIGCYDLNPKIKIVLKTYILKKWSSQATLCNRIFDVFFCNDANLNIEDRPKYPFLLHDLMSFIRQDINSLINPQHLVTNSLNTPKMDDVEPILNMLLKRGVLSFQDYQIFIYKYYQLKSRNQITDELIHKTITTTCNKVNEITTIVDAYSRLYFGYKLSDVLEQISLGIINQEKNEIEAKAKKKSVKQKSLSQNF